MKKFITILAMFFLMAGTAMAGSLCLEWDANTDPDLAGYKIFVRAEGNTYDYANPSWQGTDTTCSITLADGETFYVVGRAYDTEGLESEDSSELSWFHDFPWINTPPSTIDLRIIDCATLP